MGDRPEPRRSLCRFREPSGAGTGSYCNCLILRALRFRLRGIPLPSRLIFIVDSTRAGGMTGAARGEAMRAVRRGEGPEGKAAVCRHWCKIAGHWAAIGVLAMGILYCPQAPARADDPAADPKQQGASEIPWNRLAPEERQRAADVVDKSVLYRRMPTEVFRCDPEVYLYLINRPDVTTAVWRVLGMSKLKLEQVDPDRYSGDDGGGTEGGCEFLHRSPDLHVLLCEGKYQGPLMLKPLQASVLLVLRSAYFHEATGQGYVAHRLDAFVQVESDMAEALARLSSPLTLRMADRTFRDVTTFLAAMSRWIGTRAGWAYRLSDRLREVPDAEKRQFRALVDAVSQRQSLLTQREPRKRPALIR